MKFIQYAYNQYFVKIFGIFQMFTNIANINIDIK